MGNKLGTIVMLPGCGDGVVVSRLMGAPHGGRSMTNVCPGHVTELTCCWWWGSLILRFRLVGDFDPLRDFIVLVCPVFAEFFVAADGVSLSLLRE